MGQTLEASLALEPGVTGIPADLPDCEADIGPLFEKAKRIFPQSVNGFYRSIKWYLLVITLGIYYFLPFVRWDRGPGFPSQAVLVDLDHRRFYFFFIEIWPQEIYYVTGLLILAALTLFLMNALAGRVWCGYLCPQTVWTDLFLAVERLIEGDRRERMIMVAGPWTLERVCKLILKHWYWLMIAWWTGGVWVFYFTDAPTLVVQLLTYEAPRTAWVAIFVLTCTTYLLAGFMREQVCLYMCPWPRIQAAMTDEYALNVTYRGDRGEPRMSVRKAQFAHEIGLPGGDCVDCGQCKAVCPTGIDIREGSQLGCIQCGLCIDACDSVMAKIGRPPRLIAYDTDVNCTRRAEGKPPISRLIRSRTVLYTAIISLVGGVMLVTLATRASSNISVIHDRNPLFVRLSSGAIRNAYTVRVTNRDDQSRPFSLSIDGLEGAILEIVGTFSAVSGRPVIDVGPDQTREVRLLVTNPLGQTAVGSIPINFKITNEQNYETSEVTDHFILH